MEEWMPHAVGSGTWVCVKANPSAEPVVAGTFATAALALQWLVKNNSGVDSRWFVCEVKTAT